MTGAFQMNFRMIGALSLLACLVIVRPCEAEALLLEHLDEFHIEEGLTLEEVVNLTYERYPQSALVAAYEEESRALEQRSTSWIAGFPMIYLQYIDDSLISDRGISEIQSGYQIPVWMWGQREASQRVTEEARFASQKYATALKLEIAGLVRNTLWNLRIVENRREIAKQIYEVAQRLTQVVGRRVELGDLSRQDQLLAQGDELEKKTVYLEAEAEVMHARKAYQNLTRMSRAPAQFDEIQSKKADLDEQHPSLAAADASVERAQAEVEFTRRSKQGNQPSIMIGTDSTSVAAAGSRARDYGTGTNLVLQIPIGGDNWHAPAVAQANVALNERIVQRETLRRQLEKALHEARHNLEVDSAALVVLEQRRTIAESQIAMSRISFEAGEISLIDYLKIQTGAQSAIRDARERALMVKRDTATLNQVLGVAP